MAASPKRSISNFNLSFLDIMFCGFGAVVLLVLIINSNIVDNRVEKIEDRRLEHIRHNQISANLNNNRNQLQHNYQTLKEQLSSLKNKHDSLAAEINNSKVSTANPNPKNIYQKITALEMELKALQTEKLQLEEDIIKTSKQGSKARQFEGEGNRQYLTGLKLGGKRVLILIDSSASMLDTKIVDIIRLKIRDASTRRSAAKWQRAVETVEWILANLPPDCSVQIYSFDTEVNPLTTAGNTWTKVTEFSIINKAVEKLAQIAPANGTSLELAFLKARTITPRPNNIILITDGLPTQGKNISSAKTVTGEKRVNLFEQAVKRLPADIPVNTILFPIEGDPMASVLFWKLAIDTGGSFFTPTMDWP